jgi:Flp pilus assembly protein TadB
MTLLIPLLARVGIPEAIRKPMQYLLLALFAAGLIWAAAAAYNAAIIDRHEERRAVDQIPAIEKSAEDRAHDALTNIMAEHERTAAIDKVEREEAAKPGAERTKLDPYALAAACTVLRQQHSPAELAKMRDYQERCT